MVAKCCSVPPLLTIALHMPCTVESYIARYSTLPSPPFATTRIPLSGIVTATTVQFGSHWLWRCALRCAGLGWAGLLPLPLRLVEHFKLRNKLGGGAMPPGRRKRSNSSSLPGEEAEEEEVEEDEEDEEEVARASGGSGDASKQSKAVQYTLLPSVEQDRQLLNPSDKPTALRSIFESALVDRQSAQGFTLAWASPRGVEGAAPHDDGVALHGGNERGEAALASSVKAGKKREPKPEMGARPLHQVIAEAQALVQSKWPTPVGATFYRRDNAKEAWLASKDELRANAKQAARQAAKRGLGRAPDLKKLVKEARRGDE